MYCENGIDPKKLGRMGEEYVARYLKRKGYIIVKRNWRDRYGEVDVIAENEVNIVFVEVKTRTENALVSGTEAVDEGKRRRIRNEALMFSKRLNRDLEPRCDVAEVVLCRKSDGTFACRLNYIESAF